jgi:alanyl-tRNA synthetase
LERTSQIRILKIISTERYKGNLRLYFIAGDRAVEVLSRTYESAQEAARLLSTKIENLVDKTNEINQKTLQTERTLKKCAQQSAEAIVRLVASQTALEEPLLFRLDNDDAEIAMQLTKASCALGRSAVVVLDSEKSGVIQIPPQQNMPSLAASFKEKMSRISGKGGGNATFFRAQFASVDGMRTFLVEVNKFLKNSNIVP